MSEHPRIVLAQGDGELVLVELGEGDAPDAIAGRQAGGSVPGRIRPLGLAPSFASRQLIDVDMLGSTIVLLLDRRPPLLVSHDAGRTWHERGSGLPPGVALALGESPDHLLYGSAHRLHLSLDGGIFWRSLAVELDSVQDVAWS